MGPEQTGTTGTAYEGHRDVVDVSWAIYKFFFLFYSGFFGTNIFRYLLLRTTMMLGHHHHHRCESLLAGWKDEGEGTRGKGDDDERWYVFLFCFLFLFTY